MIYYQQYRSNSMKRRPQLKKKRKNSTEKKHKWVQDMSSTTLRKINNFFRINTITQISYNHLPKTRMITFIFDEKIQQNNQYQIQHINQLLHLYANIQQNMHIQAQKQKIALDQHYSNNILFTTLSTLEEISRNLKSAKTQKKFAHYDKYDYSSKNLTELKNQLKVHLHLMRISKQIFANDYGEHNYKLPSQFNIEKVFNQLDQFAHLFNMKKEHDCLEMVEDLKKILKGKMKELNYEHKEFKTNYSEAEKKSQRKNLLHSGIKAQHFMDQEQKRVEKMGNQVTQEELPVYVTKSQIPQRGTSVQHQRKTFQERKVKESPVGKVTSGEKDAVIKQYFSKYGVETGKSSNIRKRPF